MANISLCETKNCPLAEKCRRKESHPIERWQSWIAPFPSLFCEEFLPIKETKSADLDNQ